MPSVHQVQLACKVVHEHFGSLTEVRPSTENLTASLVKQTSADECKAERHEHGTARVQPAVGVQPWLRRLHSKHL
jgi:hypothetical protein